MYESSWEWDNGYGKQKRHPKAVCGICGIASSGYGSDTFEMLCQKILQGKGHFPYQETDRSI